MRQRRRSLRARGGQPRPRGVRSKPWFAAVRGGEWGLDAELARLSSTPLLESFLLSWDPKLPLTILFHEGYFGVKRLVLDQVGDTQGIIGPLALCIAVEPPEPNLQIHERLEEGLH